VQNVSANVHGVTCCKTASQVVVSAVYNVHCTLTARREHDCETDSCRTVGLTVLCVCVSVQLANRNKNNKKSPTPLTEDMLNELNKNHMGGLDGGLDNCGADDLYSMDDVWNDKPPKKVTW